MDNHYDKFVLVEYLQKHFKLSGKQKLKAVDGISFYIKRGETLGLVGESGCGKSTTGKTILGLHKPTNGKILIDGQDITKLSSKEKKQLTRKIQMIFQDPYASLNPRMTVSDIIAEGLIIHNMGTPRTKLARVHELLNLVGLNKEHASRFPHEFSGGQRQRIGIARALAIEPKFIICDEPVSALDVSIQAQVINLLIKLQKELNLTYLFIAHDLSMVKHISDRIAVMYLGKLVEIADTATLFENTLHPYTKALLSAIPIADPHYEDKKQSIQLKGELPSPVNPPSGCTFRTRCEFATSACAEKEPKLIAITNDHFVACHQVTSDK